MVAAAPAIKSIGFIAVAKLIIHSLSGSYDTSIDRPPPPTKINTTFGNYCIKAQCKLVDKKNDKILRTYKGYSKDPSISDKVETICDTTTKNFEDTGFCTRPEVSFSRHLQMCNGQVEIHYEGTDKVTIIG